jgi:N-acetylglucosamine-6-phosphate deacetylase
MSNPFVLENLGSAGGIGGPSALLVEDGRITALDADAADVPAPRRLDGRGFVAVPGFIELQLNGAFGHDFTTDSATMWQVGEGLARHGITAFLPTIVTSARGTVESALDALEHPPETTSGAVPIGLHVEGPFLAPERIGAHDPALVRDPDLVELKRWAKRGGVRLLTLAPERPGALDAIRLLTRRGIVAAVGHTDADAATAMAAIDAGARYATHLFNAMPPFSHRKPGAVGALLADARVTIGLILDRHHLDPIVVSLVERLAHGRISLVSDAIAALGLRDGTHRLGDLAVAVGDGAVRLPDGTLAGTVTPLDACMRAFAAMTGAVDEAIGAVTAVPARLLGLDDGRGHLMVGGRADVVLLDEELEVQATIVGGEIAHAVEGLAWP